MKKEFNGHANKGGVYKITNQVNGKIYIGSAKLFKVRVSQHVSSLKSGKHQNKHLQNAWNKYGEFVFLFEVVEVVPGDKTARTTREQELLDEQLKADNWDSCYNLSKKVVSTDRKYWSKTRDGFSEEHKKKISESLKQHYENNPEARETISKLHKGKKRTLGYKHTEETKQKISKANKGSAHTEEAKARMSKAHTGKTMSKETREKISQARKGLKMSAATREKMSLARKKYFEKLKANE